MSRDSLQAPLFARFLLLLITLALASGCGPAEPEYPTVTGNWTGTGVSFDTAESWTFRLEESSDGAVTGSFSIRVGRLVFSGNAGGTHTYPAVSLDLDLVFFGAVVSGTYQGQVISPDSIDGRVRLIEDMARTLHLNRLGS
ncbi:MAG: hypothetical protein OXI83_09610 [Gemmatimonadota bacterium]|nr:hypothetical protein [Gemmatimonadota bacterium]